MNIERNEERILLKYVDANFNTYKCVITDTDVFVVNFCRRDLAKMEEILKKHIIVEMDEYYLFKVEDPIFLEYQLKKEKQEEITNLGIILEKFKILEEENKMLKEKVEKLESSFKLKKEKQEEITNIGLILEKFKILEEENKMLKEKVEILEPSFKSIKNITNYHKEFISQFGDSVWVPELDRFFPKNIKEIRINKNSLDRYSEINNEDFEFKQFKNFTELNYIFFSDIEFYHFQKFNLNSLKIIKIAININFKEFTAQEQHFKNMIKNKIRIVFENEFLTNWGQDSNNVEIKRKN